MAVSRIKDKKIKATGLNIEKIKIISNRPLRARFIKSQRGEVKLEEGESKSDEQRAGRHGSGDLEVLV